MSKSPRSPRKSPRRIMSGDLPQSVQGYLFKMKPGILKGIWQKRWFRVEGDKLFYYKTKRDLEHLGFLDLSCATIETPNTVEDQTTTANDEDTRDYNGSSGSSQNTNADAAVGDSSGGDSLNNSSGSNNGGGGKLESSSSSLSLSLSRSANQQQQQLDADPLVFHIRVPDRVYTLRAQKRSHFNTWVRTLSMYSGKYKIERQMSMNHLSRSVSESRSVSVPNFGFNSSSDEEFDSPKIFQINRDLSNVSAERQTAMSDIRALMAKVEQEELAVSKAVKAINDFKTVALLAVERLEFDHSSNGRTPEQESEEVGHSFLEVHRALVDMNTAMRRRSRASTVEERTGLREAIELQKRAESAEEKFDVLADRFFFSEALCVKLNALLMGSACNLDLHALHAQAKAQDVDPLQYSTWIQSKMEDAGGGGAAGRK